MTLRQELVGQAVVNHLWSQKFDPRVPVDFVIGLYRSRTSVADVPANVCGGGKRSMAGLSSLLQNSTIHTQRDDAIAVCRQRAVELGRLEDEFDVSLKMYILVKESVETGYAVTAAAHAAVAVTCTYSHTWEVRTWLCGIFRKVVCRVTDAEFEKAKAFPNRVVMTESALGGQEVALGFMPRTDWPKAFRFYRLY